MRKTMILVGLILLMGFAFSSQSLAGPTTLFIDFNDWRSETAGICFYVTEAHLYSGRGVWRESPVGKAYNEQSQSIAADLSDQTDCVGTPKGYIRFKPCENCTPPNVADCDNCDQTVTLTFDLDRGEYRLDDGMREERCGTTFVLDVDTTDPDYPEFASLTVTVLD